MEKISDLLAGVPCQTPVLPHASPYLWTPSVTCSTVSLSSAGELFERIMPWHNQRKDRTTERSPLDEIHSMLSKKVVSVSLYKDETEWS